MSLWDAAEEILIRTESMPVLCYALESSNMLNQINLFIISRLLQLFHCSNNKLTNIVMKTQVGLRVSFRKQRGEGTHEVDNMAYKLGVCDGEGRRFMWGRWFVQ